jgi:Holliday junction resolvasome RuvABC ATP-dependent DNA helicase subunit
MSFLINKLDNGLENTNLVFDSLSKEGVQLVYNNYLAMTNNDYVLRQINQLKNYQDIDIYQQESHPAFKPYKKKIKINTTIDSLNDLICLCHDYPLSNKIKYSIDMKMLHNIRDDLVNLNNMVGLDALKTNILEQLLYYVQGFHKNNENDYLHTVLYGPPGTGKTEIAKILGNIYSKIGILKNNIFKKVTRSDLIAGYLGQTALKTRKVIENNLGGVVFIDEAYALGHTNKDDSFAKEAIDTLCECLSDHKNDIMVIIAGYEKELQKCFFKHNSGLESRFSWRFHLEKYEAKDLRDILLHKIKKDKWTIDENILTSEWMQERKNKFSSNGRDMENLLTKIKIAHSRRIFGMTNKKYQLTLEDLDNGFEKFKQYYCSKEDKLPFPSHLYT